MKNNSLKRISLIVVIALFMGALIPINAMASNKVKAKSVTISAKTVTLSEGDVVTLTATKSPKKAKDSFKWSSSNKNVATVSSKGVVKAVKEGNATITVVASLSKKKASCSIKVKHYMTKFEVNQLIDSQLASFTTIEMADIDTRIEKKISESGLVTEEQVNTIVSDTINKGQYVTQSDVAQMIAGSSDGKVEWEDGTEVVLYKKQTLPFKMQLNHTWDYYLMIDSISLKKTHNYEIESVSDTEDGFLYYRYDPFIYSCTIKGRYSSNYNDSHVSHMLMSITAWSNDWTVVDGVDISFQNVQIDTVGKTFTLNTSWKSKKDVNQFMFTQMISQSYDDARQED